MRTQKSRGQTLAEFALVVPIFLLLLMGVFDVGRAVWFQNEVEQLANQAARQAAVRLPGGACTGMTKSACIDAIVAEQRVGTSATATKACRNADGTTAAEPLNSCPLGKTIYVKVSVQWAAITPIIGTLLGPTAFASEATLPVE